MNKKVLMSGAEHFSNEAWINPYYGDAIDTTVAVREHDTIRRAFEQAGIEVVKVDSPSTSQDGIYTANWGLCRGEKCVLSRLPGPRKPEEAYAEKILTRLGKTVIRVPEGLKFSGQGDSLPCGRYLLAGSGYRSDQAAQEFVADELGLELVQLRAIPELDKSGQPVVNPISGWPDSFFYDIDLVVAVLREDLIAYCPEALDAASQAKIEALPLEKIIVSYPEAVQGFACNLVSTGQTVIMSSSSPTLRADIESHGLKVIPIHAVELPKGGGYIRCVSLTLD
ncbi:MAG: amidinotransferase [Candidatus Nomurabacteria bacterium]|jgi:N-dimethylarginine dimethylaminohydrolase|nr:amidinotransferase [Candidatus Nomurabacteria bacterium]